MDPNKGPLLRRALEVWLLIVAAETVHGFARVAILEPLVGDFRARQIAVFTGSLIILTIAVVFRNWMPLSSGSRAGVVGVFWVVLTIAFEIILGRFVANLSWERILEDYNMSEGGLMPLGFLFMFLSPFAARWYVRRDSLT